MNELGNVRAQDLEMQRLIAEYNVDGFNDWAKANNEGPVVDPEDDREDYLEIHHEDYIPLVDLATRQTITKLKDGETLTFNTRILECADEIFQEFLVAVRNAKQLKNISVRFHRFDFRTMTGKWKQSLEAMQANVRWNTLNLGYGLYRLPDRSITVLKNLLLQKDNLFSLSLSGALTRCQADDINEYGKVISKMPGLQTIVISDNGLTEYRHRFHLLNQIALLTTKEKATLTSVDASSFFSDPRELDYLFKLKLKRINVSHSSCEFDIAGTYGVYAWCETLAKHSSLEELDMSLNYLGCRHLVHACTPLPPLGRTTFDQLMAAVKENTTITSLNLAGNELQFLPIESINLMAQTFHRHPTLASINLKGDRIMHHEPHRSAVVNMVKNTQFLNFHLDDAITSVHDQGRTRKAIDQVRMMTKTYQSMADIMIVKLFDKRAPVDLMRLTFAFLGKNDLEMRQFEERLNKNSKLAHLLSSLNDTSPSAPSASSSEATSSSSSTTTRKRKAIE